MKIYEIVDKGKGLITQITPENLLLIREEYPPIVNLGYTASPVEGVISNSAGMGVTLPLVTSINSGLMSPELRAIALSALQPTDNYWTKTDDDIRNNNIGNIEIKLQSGKKFRLLDNINTVLAEINILGTLSLLNNIYTGNGGHGYVYSRYFEVQEDGGLQRSGNHFYAKVANFESNVPVVYSTSQSTNTDPLRLVALEELISLGTSFVPFTGADLDVNLGTNDLTAYNLTAVGWADIGDQLTVGGSIVAIGDVQTENLNVNSDITAGGTIIGTTINASGNISASSFTGGSATISGNIIAGGDVTGSNLSGINTGNNAINLNSNAYTDSIVIGYAPLAGAIFTGDVQVLTIPTNSNSATSKNYVDGLITGISWKQEVVAATVVNITLSAPQTIDSISLIAGDRVLVKNQSTGSQNGIYLVSAGAWTRALDADTSTEIATATVMVRNGTINKDTQWTCTNITNPTIGVDAITFGQISGAGTYTNGTGLTLSGNVFAVDASYVSTGVAAAIAATVVTLNVNGPLANAGTSTNPVINLPQSTAFISGYLASTDWATFNSKQAALSGTGFVKSTAGVISYDTNTYLTTGSAVTSVSGTASRITSTGTTTPVIDISATFEALLGKVANPLSQFASTTSAQVAGMVPDKTGSGALVFGTSPTFTTGITTPAITISGGTTITYLRGDGAAANLSTAVRIVTLSGLVTGNNTPITTSSTIINAFQDLQAQISGSFVYNATTVALSSATLNSTYPSVPIGTRISCPNIIAGGIEYTKQTEAGGSDVWFMSTITVAP